MSNTAGLIILINMLMYRADFSSFRVFSIVQFANVQIFTLQVSKLEFEQLSLSRSSASDMSAISAKLKALKEQLQVLKAERDKLMEQWQV